MSIGEAFADAADGSGEVDEVVEPSVANIRNARDLDAASLKALAHPLRVQIFDALSIYGAFTASGLAERLNESSGATSYHLRQLEKHGFVREVEGRGTGRERWWERTPGSINIGSEEALQTPAGRSAADTVFRQMRVGEEKLLDDFVTRGHDELSSEWMDASDISTMNTRLTAEQLRNFVREVLKLADTYVLPYKGQQVPGARPVHITFNAFPVMDGSATPHQNEDENA